MSNLNDLVNDLASMKSDFTARKPILNREMGIGLKTKIQNNTPVDTGKLLNSYEVEAGKDSVSVFSSVDYDVYVDEGHMAGHTFVPGRHMYDLGLMQYEPVMDKTINAFLDTVKGIGD